MPASDKKWTLADIKAANTAAGFYFFSRSTMHFFGDTMRSFAARNRPDGIFIERIHAPTKVSCGVKWIGDRWRFDPATGDISTLIKE